MNKKQSQRVKNIIRKLTFSDPFRKAKKALAYRGPAVHECENCGVYCYDGTSLKNATKAFEKYGEIFTCESKNRKGKTVYVGAEMDHIVGLPKINDPDFSWDDFLFKLFPESIDGWRCICVNCHECATYEQNAYCGKDNRDIITAMGEIYGFDNEQGDL